MPKGVHNGQRLGRTPVSKNKRFSDKYIPEPNSGCWLWTGVVWKNGYGAIRGEKNKWAYAHRTSFEIHSGKIPDGYYVCHKCDNRICVNPDHLYAGTASDNQYDRWRSERKRKNDNH